MSNPDPTVQELQNEIATIILMDFHTRVMNYPRGKTISADAEAAKIVALLQDSKLKDAKKYKEFYTKRQAKAVREAIQELELARSTMSDLPSKERITHEWVKKQPKANEEK